MVCNDQTIKEMNEKVRKKINNSSFNLKRAKKAVKFFKLNSDQKKLLCIYCGCDYVTNVKGIGFGKLIELGSDFDKVGDYIEEFINNYIDNGQDVLPDIVKDIFDYFDLTLYVQAIFLG